VASATRGLSAANARPTPDARELANGNDPLMKLLIVVNDQPYGSERPYNALRLAGALSKRQDVELRVFLLGDAVACAVADQQLPDGHYHLDRMLKGLVRRAQVGCCGTCLDARGLSENLLVDGAHRSTLEELTDWTLRRTRR
jgi:uncharacterized protein involved in oxidation of intracellular sulfur